MNLKHVNFPSIGQYRNVVKHIKHSSSFVGLDENSEPIYENLRPKPILRFQGTVKIHGTLGAICYSSQSGLYTQSRKNVLSIEKDNIGFCSFVHVRKIICRGIIKNISDRFEIDTNDNIITLFGEFFGGSIQKGVGVNGLEKSFAIFDIKITPIDENEESHWLNMDDVLGSVLNNELGSHNIYFINQFPVFEIEINFNKPEMYQNKLIDYTMIVEENCPVAQQLREDNNIRDEQASTIGEGIVFKGEYKGERLSFKLKGQKHTSTKIKKLPVVDEAKENLKNEVVNKITPAFRLEQGIQETFDTLNGGEIDRKNMGDFIRWVMKDIIKEDLDIVADVGLCMKDINSKISKVVRDYFFQQEQL